VTNTTIIFSSSTLAVTVLWSSYRILVSSKNILLAQSILPVYLAFRNVFLFKISKTKFNKFKIIICWENSVTRFLQHNFVQVVEHNKRKHSSLQQGTENLEIFAVPSLVTQKKYNNDNCIVLVIIYITFLWCFSSAWALEAHAMLVFFCENFAHSYIYHIISHIPAYFTKNDGGST